MNDPLTCGGCAARLLRPTRKRRVNGPARVVAVSGGIGSGKSTLTRVLASLGGFVADADAIARDVLAPGSETLERVARRFGRDLILPDGSLDRALLASRVFSPEEGEARVEELNAITHPVIGERARQILGSAPDGSLAVYDVPLLVAPEDASRFDAVIMIDAPEDVRVVRLAGRGVRPEDARARIRAQASSDRRRAIASIWIDNEGSAADLAKVARLVHDRWLMPDAPAVE